MMTALRLAGRILALMLIAAGLLLGWFGIAEMLFEKPSAMFWRSIVPSLALIGAGLLLDEFAWRRLGQVRHRS